MEQTHNKEPENLLVDLFSIEIEARIKKEGRLYRRKIEPIKGAEKITETRIVETRLPDGTLESSFEAKIGDWLITGSKGEQFVLT